MPRKVSYGLDYDEDYDDYEEDDDFHLDYDADDAGNVPASHKEPLRSTPKIWRCAICTYDNEEGFTACDICGVLRSSAIDANAKKTVDNDYKCYGVSKMAWSLFAPLARQTSKSAVLLGELDVDNKPGDCTILLELGNDKENFDKLHRDFTSYDKNKLSIVPFKFDIQSPDDLVSNGLWFSKMGSKAAASSKKDLSTERTSTASAENSNVVISRSRRGNVNESVVDIEEHGSRSGIDAPGSSSLSMQRTHGHADRSNFSKHDALDSVVLKSNSLSGSGKVAVEHGTSVNTYKHHALARSLNKVSFSDESTNNKQKASSLSQYSPEKWMLPEKGESVLTQLNIAIVGHVDSGKSTLSGRLLHLSGRISQKEMHKYEKEAKLQGKGSFAFAWALDESPEERERGITMTVAVAYFDTKKYHVVMLDSPGHKDFVPNMISGAGQADAAVLVIDASMGSFEAGMDSNKGQTREHTQLIRSFGVEQLIVAVNKMDAVEYSEDRYELIKRQLGTFLRSSGFKDKSVLWVPMSAIANQNLEATPSDVRFSSWYKGPYLLEAIDSLPPPVRDFSRPLVMPVGDVIRSPSTGQASACGKLESGAMRSGLKVLVMPSGHLGTVKSMEQDSRPLAIARAGDHVAVFLQGVDGSHITKGGVLCHPDFPISVAKYFELKVLTLECASPILIGSQFEFHIHHTMEAARVTKIISLLDPKTGKEMKRCPRILTAKQSAVVEVVLQGPVCAGVYSNCKALGRVSLRATGRTLAVGIVTRVIEE